MIAMRLAINSFDLLNMSGNSQCQTQSCYTFSEVINHKWNSDDETPFYWDHYWHATPADWNTTRDLTGLHYSTDEHDMALDKETQGRMARSILFDDKYDSLRGKMFLSLQSLREAVNKVRVVDVQNAKLQSWLDALPAFGTFAVYFIISITLAAQMRKQTVLWSNKTLKSLLGVTFLLTAVSVSLLVIYILRIEAWVALMDNKWMRIEHTQNVVSKCEGIVQMSRKYSQFMDKRALTRFKDLMGSDGVAGLGQKASWDQYQLTDEELAMFSQHEDQCLELARRGAISIRISGWVANLSDAFLMDNEWLYNLTWNRSSEPNYAVEQYTFPGVYEYTDYASDKEKDPSFLAKVSRWTLYSLLYESKYRAWRETGANLLQLIVNRGVTESHSMFTQVQTLGNIMIIISATWMLEAVVMLLFLANAILVQRIGGMEHDMQAAGVVHLLSEHKSQCKLGMFIVILCMIGSFTFTTMFSAEVSSLPMTLYKPCTLVTQLGHSLFLARQLLDSSVFRADRVAKSKLKRAVLDLRKTYQHVRMGFDFGHEIGHEQDPDWTTYVEPLVGKWAEVDSYFTGEELPYLLDAKIGYWLELLLMLTEAPEWVLKENQVFRSLLDMFPETEEQMTQLCADIGEQSTQQLHTLRLLTIIVLVTVTVFLLGNLRFVSWPMTHKLLSDDDASVYMLLLVPEEVRNSVTAIREYLEYGRLQSEHVALRNALVQSEKLVGNVFSPGISQRIKSGEYPIADPYQDVTLLFSDLCGFTKLSSSISASDLVMFLDALYGTYDSVVETHGLQKIKTIGDAYFCVGNCAIPLEDAPVVTVSAALEILTSLKRLAAKWKEWKNINQRIGIHIGNVVGGVIGRTAMLFDLWGDAVNVASRMESTSLPGYIQISSEMHHLVGHEFRCKPRQVNLKGKGNVTAYLVVEEDHAQATRQTDDEEE
mmetsp:Transcript_113577/g.197327  ORF Transcript_113577/g.197327 Transcript_113577/m.197327 type:complete len:935 (-) Transcript_113577:658-3462(-)